MPASARGPFASLADYFSLKSLLHNVLRIRRFSPYRAFFLFSASTQDGREASEKPASEPPLSVGTEESGTGEMQWRVWPPCSPLGPTARDKTGVLDKTEAAPPALSRQAPGREGHGAALPRPPATGSPAVLLQTTAWASFGSDDHALARDSVPGGGVVRVTVRLLRRRGRSRWTLRGSCSSSSWCWPCCSSSATSCGERHQRHHLAAPEGLLRVVLHSCPEGLLRGRERSPFSPAFFS